MARKYRDRIKVIRTVKASELVVNEENWRKHPTDQRKELQSILTEVGNVDVLKAVERADGSLLLVDGHLRKDLNGDSEVRVAVLDLDEAETRKVLEAFDRIAAMAQTDSERLDNLICKIRADEQAGPPPLDDRAVQDVVDTITQEEPVRAADERKAADTASRVSGHVRRLAEISPELLNKAAVVILPPDGSDEALIIVDPDLHDIVRELRQRHEDGETHPLDALFACIWTPKDAINA